MNKRISQFDIVDTLEPGDLIPIVNQDVTKKTQLSAINNIPITFAKETFLPFTGGTVTGNLQIDNDLHVKDDITVNDTATIVNLISTGAHGTSLNWVNAYTAVTQNSATWATGGTIVQSNSAKWQSTYTTVNTNSSKWENAYKILEDNAYDWSNTLGGEGTFGYVPKFTDTTKIDDSGIYENIATDVGIGIKSPLDAKLTVNGKIKGLGDLEILGHSTLSSVHVRSSLRVDGVLSALGGTVNITTRVSEASSLKIYNIGTGPALSVTQTGAQDVATFADENGPIMCITDAGNVGIGPSPCNTDTTVKLDVKGAVRIGGTKIRDWASTTDIELENTKPGVTGTGSSQFGTILEGVNNGHVLIGLRSNDSNDGFAIVSRGSSSGYPSSAVYDKNCFTVLNTGKVGINIRKPTQELHVVGTYLQTADAAGDYIIRVQDGSGRINHYWNTVGCDQTDPLNPKWRFAKGGESATRWLLGGAQDQNPFEVYISQDGTTAGTGDIINWTKLFTINRASQYIGAGVDTPLRHLHIANRVNGSTEVILEQREAAVNYKKWNFVVDGGSAATGGGVGSRFYVRQLNDLGSGGNIPVYFASNGKIGINNEFAPAEALDVSGNIKMGNWLSMGKEAKTAGDDVAIEIGLHRTADGESYVDFHTTPGTDYSGRLIRQTGANGNYELINTGTGILTVTQKNASSIYLQTSDTRRVEVDKDGNVGIGIGAGADARLHVCGLTPNDQVAELKITGSGGGWMSHHCSASTSNWNPLAVNDDKTIIFTNGAKETGNLLIAPWSDFSKGLKINSNGVVLIGTTTPTVGVINQQKLEVSGSIMSRIDTAEGGRIELVNNAKTGTDVSNWTIYNMTSQVGGAGSSYPKGLHFWRYAGNNSNLGTSFFLSDDGDVSVGTTNPKVKFQVSGIGATLWGNNSTSGGAPVAANKIASYPPDGAHANYTAVFEAASHTDSGGILIITGDNNDDERALEVWSEVNKKSIFQVKAQSGDTYIDGTLTTNGDLSLNNANLKQFKVIIKDWQPTTALNNGDEYTLQPSDTGAVLYVKGTLATYIIVPTTLPEGFNIMIVNGTAKSCTIQGASGMQVVNVNNKITIGSQNGICNLVVLATNRTLISGDLS